MLLLFDAGFQWKSSMRRDRESGVK